MTYGLHAASTDGRVTRLMVRGPKDYSFARLARWIDASRWEITCACYSESVACAESARVRVQRDRTYVSRVERGVRNPNVLVLKAIADALKVPPGRLLDASYWSDVSLANAVIFARR